MSLISPRKRPARPPLPAGPLDLAVVLDFTAVGGSEVQILELFRHLDPAVVRPRLVCLRRAGPLAAEFRAAGFPVSVLDRQGRYDMRTLPRLLRDLRRNGTAAVLVVHFHRASLTLGRLAARLSGAVNLIAVRDMDLVQVGLRCLPRYVVNTLFLSDALVLQAPSQGSYLHEAEGVGRYRWQRTREVVIRNGIDLRERPGENERAAARAALGAGPDEVVVGIVARLAAQKAHEVLLRAVAVLADDHPRLLLVVVGGGEREGELRALAREWGLADRVVFTGVRRDVPALLAAFDIFCLSSVHEGTPVTVIEAMAAGIPVVLTDAGAVRDMVSDGEEGFVVPVGDVVALADRIARLATDPDLRGAMGVRGRRRAEADYPVQAMARRFEELLTELVAAPSGDGHGRRIGVRRSR